MESVGWQKVVGGCRLICEAGTSGLLTSIGRQADVGKREAGLTSVEKVERWARLVLV